MVAGGLICWAQDRFGLVSMGMENAIVASYPVEIRSWDFIYIATVVVLITLTISFYPAVLAARSYSQKEL